MDTILEEKYRSTFCHIYIAERHPGVRIFKLFIHGKSHNTSLSLTDVIIQSDLSKEQKEQALQDLGLNRELV
jgi:hypothetical protein